MKDAEKFFFGLLGPAFWLQIAHIGGEARLILTVPGRTYCTTDSCWWYIGVSFWKVETRGKRDNIVQSCICQEEGTMDGVHEAPGGVILCNDRNS